jgi:two-component system, cell cycle response regulator
MDATIKADIHREGNDTSQREGVMNLQRETRVSSPDETMAGTVLVIDDSPVSREEVAGTLIAAGLFSKSFAAGDGLEGLKILAEVKADLIICDMEMPRLDGIRFLQLVKAQPQLREIPVIILTSNIERKVKLMVLEQGANDYLTKPVDAAELVARARIHLKMKRLQDELRAARNHFKELSNTDPLTNLYNRRFFAEILESELQRSRRLKSALSLLLVDIDHFKNVNDSYGHQMGDRVLVAVTETLRKGLRSYDIASRYGGEEFILILPATPIAAAVEVAERLRQSVASRKLDLRPEKLVVTVSIGVSSFPCGDADNGDLLLQRADKALYSAKNNGRNRVEAVGAL